MQATLRQEGLIGQLRAQRPDPLTAGGDTASPPADRALSPLPARVDGATPAEEGASHNVFACLDHELCSRKVRFELSDTIVRNCSFVCFVSTTDVVLTTRRGLSR